nr:MAG TPA_asm: DNA directed RNA polymerase subunit [Caudoviricetes sp.]
MFNFNNAPIEDGVKQYLDDLKDIQPLSKEEEKILFRRYRQENDLNARNKIITANLRYAAKIAYQYKGYGLSYWDLLSEANDGLIKSIDKFKLEFDVKFVLYSRWWIVKAVQDAIERLSKRKEDCLPQNYYMLSEENDKVEEFDNNKSSTIILVDEERYDASHVNELFKGLKKREIDMVKMHFGIGLDKPLTNVEISRKFKVSSECVRKVIRKTIRKMRSKALVNDKVYL